MALQRFSASSSSDYESYSDDGTSEAQSDVSIEPAAKRPKPMVESMRNLSWDQLQSLELDADGVLSMFHCSFNHRTFIPFHVSNPTTELVSNPTCSKTGGSSTYQENGKSLARVEQALKKPCCKGNCKRHLVLKAVMTLVVAFWSLSKTSQDSLSLAVLCHTFGKVHMETSV